jgi:DNA-binding MarR family transcriptional regulator
MSDKRKRELLDNLERSYKVVQQSSSKGISASDLKERLKVHKTTAHGYLNSLELMGRVYSQHGLWYSNTSIRTASSERDEYQRLEDEIEKAKEDFIRGQRFEAQARLDLAVITIPSEKRSPQLQNMITEIREAFTQSERFWARRYLSGSQIARQAKENIIVHKTPLLIEELQKYVQGRKRP